MRINCCEHRIAERPRSYKSQCGLVWMERISERGREREREKQKQHTNWIKAIADTCYKQSNVTQCAIEQQQKFPLNGGLCSVCRFQFIKMLNNGWVLRVFLVSFSIIHVALVLWISPMCVCIFHASRSVSCVHSSSFSLALPYALLLFNWKHTYRFSCDFTLISYLPLSCSVVSSPSNCTKILIIIHIWACEPRDREKESAYSVYSIQYMY